MAAINPIEGYAPPPGQVTHFIFGEASFLGPTLSVMRLPVPRDLYYRKLYALWFYANGATGAAAIEGEIVFYRDGLVVSKLPMSNGQQIPFFNILLGRSLVSFPGLILNQSTGDTRDGLNLRQILKLNGVNISGTFFLSTFYMTADCDEIVLNINSLSSTAAFGVPPTFFLGVSSEGADFSPEEFQYE